MKIHIINLGKIVANCYLLEENDRFILIDTGRKSKKKKILKAIQEHGCEPSDLGLIIMTHGHFDHTGLGSFFQGNFGTPIAMHKEAGNKVAKGDMFYGSTDVSGLSKMLVNSVFTIERFKPDVLIEDGMSLIEYGIEGRILHTPGHSNGSVSILLDDGQLICGDLFENTKMPQLSSIQEDRDQMVESYKIIKKYAVSTVYPGHGDPFDFSALDID